MARFYTNENVPLPVAEELRRLGHDVVTVAESGNAGTSFSDSEVLDFSTREDRILVTLNRRHFIRLHRERPEHAGIMACTFDQDFAGQAGRIHRKVQERGDMRGQLERINRPRDS